LYFFNQIKGIEHLETFEREVNLNADRKRLWLGRIESIDERIMNESMPLSLNYFLKELI